MAKQTQTQENMEKLLKSYNALKTDLSQITNIEDRRAASQEQYADQQRVINELMANFSKLTKDQKDSLDDLITAQISLKKAISDDTAELKKQSVELKAQQTALDKQIKSRKELLALGQVFVDTLKAGWKYLQESDKVIKQTNLTLGLSGAKSEAMRVSFEKSIGHVSELGGTMEDIGKIQTGFADETGRARAMTSGMVEDIVAMGKGTGLGIEQATQLAAQFEYMGLNTKATLNYVQDVVDTSERMGVNTIKVLKNISDNFKKLGTFSFKNGTKAFAEMAMNAEKTRVSMTTALNVAESKRSLEDVIELGANLQVMGGKFAEMDPFKWLYMVRNEPEKLTEELSNMTTGIYTLKKNSQGIFEEFISPADVDRLKNVAKSLGISNEEMFEIAKRKLALNTLDKQLSGLGLSKAQKELVAGAATLDTKTGKYQVMLAGTMQDISNMTAEQAKSFEQEQQTLADRAKESQTFDEAFKNTVNALKGALLPILRGVNAVIDFARPMIKWLSNLAGSGWGGVLAAGGILMGSALLWSVVLKSMGNVATNWSNKVVKNKAISTAPAPATANTGGAAAGGKAGARSFGQSAGIGAAVGLAAVGVGAGIGLAAVGISKLADSMSKLTEDQADTLKSIVSSITWMVGIAAAATAALIAFGTGAALAGPELVVFGVGVALIGAGIGIAAAGLALLAFGIGTIVEKSKGAGKDMMQVGVGIAAMAAGLALFSNPLTLIGIGAFGLAMVGVIGSQLAAANVANSMAKMGVALKGSAPDFIAIKEAIESISKANISGGGMLSELATLLKSPLKVEFTSNKVAIVSDISLLIDGDVLMRKAYKADAAIQRQLDILKSGQK